MLLESSDWITGLLGHSGSWAVWQYIRSKRAQFNPYHTHRQGCAPCNSSCMQHSWSGEVKQGQVTWETQRSTYVQGTWYWRTFIHLLSSLVENGGFSKTVELQTDWMAYSAIKTMFFVCMCVWVQTCVWYTYKHIYKMSVFYAFLCMCMRVQV